MNQFHIPSLKSIFESHNYVIIIIFSLHYNTCKMAEESFGLS